MSGFGGSLGVPAAVADIDFAEVVEVLARHACNVTDAAQNLNVPSSDLRRLLWANPKLQDQAFEVVEARLDKAEKNINEALHSDDPRMRVAAGMFTIRNSVRARRRGWITSAGVGVDDNIGGQSARETVFTWRPMASELLTEEAQKKEAHRQAEVQRAIAEGHKVVQFSWGSSEGKDEDVDDSNGGWRPPTYDDGRCNGDIEGELASPAVLIEHEAAEPGPAEEPTEEPAAVEPVAAELESAVIEAPAPTMESAIDRYQREQVAAWVRLRLTPYPVDRCAHCRAPFNVGRPWLEAANDAVRIRFHSDCHEVWFRERAAAARAALGLPAG